MIFRIHRGTHEIGGTCVEIQTDITRIIIDFGMPLVDSDGSEFDFKKYKDLSISELIKKKVLPDINGIYKDSEELLDAVLISHPHQDHYGFVNYIHEDLKYFLG